MKTRIKGRYVISFEGGCHRIIPGGEVVYEDDRITYVGSRYDGTTDRTIDATHALVIPGLINLHTTTNVDLQVFHIDIASPGFLKPRAWVEDPRRPEVLDERLAEASARFSVWCMIRGGATTIGAITAMAPKRWEDPSYEPESIARAAADLGVRAYVTHQFRASVACWGARGEETVWNEEEGYRGLERAVAFVRRVHGTADGRIMGYIFPYTAFSCPPDLLRAARRIAGELGVHVRTHFAQYTGEVAFLKARYGTTPVQYLDEAGFLGPYTILTHTLYVSGAQGIHDPDGSDLRLLARRGTSVCHCPVVFARPGVILDSLSKYVAAGVNVGLGTDTYPQDMLLEMRYAACAAKMAENRAAAGSAREVFDAATLGGARALGRDDIGRLAPDAKADILVVNLDRLSVGPVLDPIRSLVYHASAADIDAVIVGGRSLIEDGRAVAVDEEALLARAREAFGRYRETFAQWDPERRPADRLFPPSFPIRE